MAFKGWPEEALEFYEGLAADNSKAYWTEHKAVYEDTVLRPMTELVEELAAEFGEAKIFRPYRDVRFSPDKSPYKTHIGAVLGTGYIQLSAEGLAAGDGMYGMSPVQLGRYRQAVLSEPAGPRAGAGDRRDRAAGHRRLGPRHAEDGSPGLPGGSPADRAAAVQGDRRLAAVAGRALAGDRGGAGPGGGLPAHHRGR